MNKSKKNTLKTRFATFSSLSIRILHIALPIILIYLFGLVSALITSKGVPPSVLSHLYTPSLEHIVMALTISFAGALVADLAERLSK